MTKKVDDRKGVTLKLDPTTFDKLGDVVHLKRTTKQKFVQELVEREIEQSMAEQ